MTNLTLLRPNVPADAAEPPLRSVSALLRNIADKLDAGAYGSPEVARGALVLRLSGQPPMVFGLGDTQVPQTFMDLHAGAAELQAMGDNAERQP